MQAKSIGPVLSYRQAKRLLRDIQTKGKVGTEGLPASGVKLRDVWPRWYEDELSRVRRGLKKADTLDIELHRLKAVTAFLRNDDVTKIDKRRLAAYQEQRLVQGRKPRTINSEMGLLCLILGWAKEHGLCSEVPHIQRLPVHRVHNGILIALLFGPSTAELMINHFDYNDDGQISRRELYADLPEGKFTAFVETVSQSGQKAFGEANSSTFAQLVKSVLGANSQPTRKSPSEKTEDLLKSQKIIEGWSENYGDGVAKEMERLLSSSASLESSRPLSIREIDNVRQQIAKCWNLPAGAKNANRIIIEIAVSMNMDGTVKDAKIGNSNPQSTPLSKAMEESALRAVLNSRCQPFKLPIEKYDRWKTMTLIFNPRELLGG